MEPGLSGRGGATGAVAFLSRPATNRRPGLSALEPRRSTAVVGQWRRWLERFKLHPYARRQVMVLINGLSEQPESWFRNLPYWRRYFDVFMPQMLVYDGPGLHQRIDEGLPISIDYLVEQLHLFLTH